MWIVICFAILVALLILVRIITLSDFGESCSDVNDDEYAEFCEEYNKAIREYNFIR